MSSSLVSYTYIYMYVCMIITYSKSKDQPGKVANPARGQPNCENVFSLSPFAPENLVSRDGFGIPVPRQPARLHTQAECGAYLLTGLPPSPAAASTYSLRPPYTLSGQSRVYWVTRLRTDGVHSRDSGGTWPVVFKEVPNGCCLGRSPWTNTYEPLFPTSPVGTKWAC